MPRRRTTRPTLTTKALDTASRGAKDTGKPVILWCGLSAGFGAKCLPSGHVAWIWQGDVSGRTRRITLNTQGDLTLTQARDAAGMVAARIALGENVADTRADRRISEKMTVATLADEYFKERGIRLRERTAKDYRDLWNRNIVPMLGARPAVDITDVEVAKLHSQITARGAVRQANYTVAVMRAVYSWAVRRRFVPTNPAKGIELNQEHHRERVANPGEIVKLRDVLSEMSNRTVADALTLLLFTGARSAEVQNATWAQFDLATDGAWTWTKPASTTKQRRVHRLPLARHAVELLKARFDAHPGTPAALVFARADGSRMSDRYFAGQWEKVRALAGLKDFKKHDLRHTAASILAADGASLPMIGAVLGHSTPITTSRYAHLVDAPVRAAVDRIASALSAKPTAEAPIVTMAAGGQRKRGATVGEATT